MLFRGMRPTNGARPLRDAFAGIELAAMSIPQALGYTSIAGMPAVTGFYTLFLPLLAFATFGSSQYLVVAADSATAAILAGGISSMAPLASAKYVLLAGTVALLTAVFLLVARLLKLDEPPRPADAADALAIAICHIHTAATLARQGSPLPGSGSKLRV